ncbi:hypothetical protein, partial [Aequorivita aquimaris]|uniref:hypothetical protein n=1 Tax=Aequorivita aquimaris TaxID=1548749 RepID=UPI0012FEECC4
FGTAGLMIRQRGQKDGLIELAGSDHTITGMVELSASIDTLNNRALFNDDLRICGIVNRSTNSGIGGGLIVPEFCEIGYYGTQAKTKISDVRADFNLGPGFVGPGRYIGCQSEKNSQARIRAYAGFQSFGASWMHLIGCLSISDGRCNYGADFDGSDYSDPESRGSITGFTSSGHTIAPIRQAGYIPTPLSLPRLEIPSRDFMPSGTQLHAGLQVWDYNGGKLYIRNHANTAWYTQTLTSEA